MWRMRLHTIVKCNMMSTDSAFTDREQSHPSRQLEALRTSRSGIEQQRVSEPFVLRLMRMTEDTDVRPGPIEKRFSLFGQLSRFKHDVPNRDADTIQLDYGFCGETALFILIDIARDSRHGSNRLKLIDNGSSTNVAGVDNMIHVMEMPHNHRVEEAVGIGNNPDADRPQAFHGLPSV